jgi:hypothetical protein
MAGRAMLAPFPVLAVCIVVVAVAVGAIAGALGEVPAAVGGIAVALAIFLADQWYVFGARRLGLLPDDARPKPQV